MIDPWRGDTVEHNSTTTVADDDSTTTATDATGEVSAVPPGAGPPREAAPDGQRRVSYVSVPPAVWALARAFAAVLGETMPPPLRIITRVVDRLGPDRARALLGQALTVEAQGGLTLPDGTRRTPGGVFFFLVRTSDTISRADKEYIFPRRHALYCLRRPQAVGEGGRCPRRRPGGRGHYRGLRRPRSARGGHRRLRHRRHHQTHPSGQARRNHAMSVSRTAETAAARVLATLRA